MKNKIVPFLLSTLLMATTVWAAATEEISMPVTKTAELSPTPLPLDVPGPTLTPTPDLNPSQPPTPIPTETPIPAPTETPIPTPTEIPPEPTKVPTPMPEVTITPEVTPIPEAAPTPELLPEIPPAPETPKPSGTPTPTKAPEEELLVMDESNSQELEAGDDKSQELIEEIAEGNLLALTIAEPNQSRAVGKYKIGRAHV